MTVPFAGSLGKGTILEFPGIQREFDLESRPDRVCDGAPQRQTLYTILQVYDSKLVGSANGNRTRYVSVQFVSVQSK